MGVLAVELVLGRPPFKGNNVEEMRKAVRGSPRLPLHASPELASFVDAALSLDAAQRPSAESLLHHPWITRFAATEAVPVSRRVPSLQAVQQQDASAGSLGSSWSKGHLASLPQCIPQSPSGSRWSRVNTAGSLLELPELSTSLRAGHQVVTPGTSSLACTPRANGDLPVLYMAARGAGSPAPGSPAPRTLSKLSMGLGGSRLSRNSGSLKVGPTPSRNNSSDVLVDSANGSPLAAASPRRCPSYTNTPPPAVPALYSAGTAPSSASSPMRASCLACCSGTGQAADKSLLLSSWIAGRRQQVWRSADEETAGHGRQPRG